MNSTDLMRKYTDIINEIEGWAGHPSQNTPPGPQPTDNVRSTNPVAPQEPNSDRPEARLPAGKTEVLSDKQLPDGRYRLGGKAAGLLRRASTPPVLTTVSKEGLVGSGQKAIWDAVRMNRQFPSKTPQEQAYHVAVNKLWQES